MAELRRSIVAGAAVIGAVLRRPRLVGGERAAGRRGDRAGRGQPRRQPAHRAASRGRDHPARSWSRTAAWCSAGDPLIVLEDVQARAGLRRAPGALPHLGGGPGAAARRAGRRRRRALSGLADRGDRRRPTRAPGDGRPAPAVRDPRQGARRPQGDPARSGSRSCARRSPVSRRRSGRRPADRADRRGDRGRRAALPQGPGAQDPSARAAATRSATSRATAPSAGAHRAGAPGDRRDRAADHRPGAPPCSMPSTRS